MEQMSVLPYHYPNLHSMEYLFYSRSNGLAVLRYSYKIDTRKEITSLIEYVNGKQASHYSISRIMPVNELDAVRSLSQFLALVLLK